MDFMKFSHMFLRDCHTSTPIPCQMGAKNAHRWTQAGETKETVTEWLNWLAADFYDEGLVKLVRHAVSSNDIKLISMDEALFCS
jgi:hypothetical protein